MTSPYHAVASKRELRLGEEGLVLQCPRCGARLGSVERQKSDESTAFVCTACLFQITKLDGIWNTLLPERETFYAKFIANYEAVREAEGRGSRNSEFYLALPERDLSGRNQSQWTIRRQSFECLDTKIVPYLQRLLKAKLDVLDLGAGNGWLSYRLALRGFRPVAVDLLTNSSDGLGAAHHYRTRVPYLFPRFRAEVDRLPFADGQFDVAIFNASFHYSEVYETTLRETLRCLRRPGFVVIADTAWYSSEQSGQQMLEERRSQFRSKFGFASDAIASQEFLTAERLRQLESIFGIRWQTFHPNYGLGWRLRPLIARLRGRREPSKFRIFLAEVTR